MLKFNSENKRCRKEEGFPLFFSHGLIDRYGYSTITDLDIQAFVDGELSGEKKKIVLSYIENNGKARERYKELCEQRELLQKWWAAHRKRLD